MDERPIINIEKKEKILGYQVLALSLKIKTWKFWKPAKYKILDILPKLFINLKEKDQICYLLFSVETLPFDMCDSVVPVTKVKTALSLASHYLTLNQKEPKALFGGAYKDGEEKHLLILKENWIENTRDIIGFISCRDFECYLLFDSEANEDKLFKELKNLYENNSLVEKNIIPLSTSVIKYALHNWKEQLILYTTGSDIDNIKNIVRDSIDSSKFEVIAK